MYRGLDIKEAITWATEAHKGQKRRITNEPYINHPIRVHEIIKKVMGNKGKENKDILIAALLHDVLEDTEIQYQELSNKFGEGIAILVKECTKPYDKLKSKNALIIKFADMLDNITDNPTDKWVTDKCTMIKGGKNEIN